MSQSDPETADPRLLRITVDSPGGHAVNLAVPLALASTVSALFPPERLAVLGVDWDAILEQAQRGTTEIVTVTGADGATVRIAVE